MRTAAIGTAVFFVLAPGTVVGLIPWWITGWQVHEPLAWWPTQAIGGVLVAAGLVPAVHAFVQFAKAGGTPAPIAPTRRLVVTGFHRYVRNPMYLSLAAAITGQALLLGQLSLLLWAAGTLLVTAGFVKVYEEPTLARQFGAEYAEYRHAVPSWWPRRRPWTPGVSR
ncbi:MAG: methyltransferase family protein [Thermocrispum sp.]